MVRPDLNIKPYYDYRRIRALSTAPRRIAFAIWRCCNPKSLARNALGSLVESGHCIGQGPNREISPFQIGRRVTKKDRPEWSAEREKDISPFLGVHKRVPEDGE
jgi:hypothetical protein